MLYLKWAINKITISLETSSENRQVQLKNHAIGNRALLEIAWNKCCDAENLNVYYINHILDQGWLEAQ